MAWINSVSGNAIPAANQEQRGQTVAPYEVRPRLMSHSEQGRRERVRPHCGRCQYRDGCKGRIYWSPAMRIDDVAVAPITVHVAVHAVAGCRKRLSGESQDALKRC